MAKKINLKMILVIVVILLALVLSVTLVKKNQENRSKAASEEVLPNSDLTGNETVEGGATEEYFGIKYTPTE